jgi:hypothetical protein
MAGYIEDYPVTISGSVTVTGTVTANAGTDLNTSALATQATLSAINTKLPSLGQAAASASVPTVAASDDAVLRSQHLGTNGQVIAIGAASVRSTEMAAGMWRISGSGDIWFRQGGSTVVATAGAESTYLSAGAIEFMRVTSAADGYLAIIRDGTETGNVSLTRTGA